LRKWIYIVAILCSLGSVITTLALTGPRPVDRDSIKPGMTCKEIEKVLPKQQTAILGRPHFDKSGSYRINLYSMESGVEVSFVSGIAERVDFVEPKPRSYLSRLIDSIRHSD
jgi:hypothetical protein